jgi:hypothetical protein
MVGRKIRYFSVDRVLDEFETLRRMDFSQICIVDDLFTANKARCLKICDGILQRGIAFPWAAFARVDTVSAELLGRMKESGCTSLCFGIESGDQGMLDRIKKKTTPEACRKAADLCHDAGIEPMMSFILGLPGETADTVRTTMEFAKTLSKSYGFHILAPFPGTEVRDRCDAYGMKILTDDWDRYDANQSVADVGSISPEAIDRAVKEFNDSLLECVGRIGKKKEAGEPLSAQEDGMWRGLANTIFNRRLILDELVDRYPGILNGSDGDAVREDFEEYLFQRMDHPREAIHDQVDRLVSLGCLEEKSEGPRKRIVWS